MFQQIEIIFSHRKQRISRNQKHHKQDIRGNNKLKRTNAFTFQVKTGGEKKYRENRTLLQHKKQKKTYFHTEKFIPRMNIQQSHESLTFEGISNLTRRSFCSRSAMGRHRTGTDRLTGRNSSLVGCFRCMCACKCFFVVVACFYVLFLVCFAYSQYSRM